MNPLCDASHLARRGCAAECASSGDAPPVDASASSGERRAVRVVAAVFFGAMLFFLAATSCGGFRRSGSSTSVPPARPRAASFGTTVANAASVPRGEAIEAPIACGHAGLAGPFWLSTRGELLGLGVTMRSTEGAETCAHATWVDASGATLEDADGLGCSLNGAAVFTTLQRYLQPKEGPERETAVYLSVAATSAGCHGAVITLHRP